MTQQGNLAASREETCIDADDSINEPIGDDFCFELISDNVRPNVGYGHFCGIIVEERIDPSLHWCMKSRADLRQLVDRPPVA